MLQGQRVDLLRCCNLNNVFASKYVGFVFDLYNWFLEHYSQDSNFSRTAHLSAHMKGDPF